VVKDDAEAVRYFRLAADHGHADAQFITGMFLLDGVGVARDEDEAVRFLGRAADQDHAGAQVSLDAREQSGIGVTKDEVVQLSRHRGGHRRRQSQTRRALTRAPLDRRRSGPGSRMSGRLSQLRQLPRLLPRGGRGR
jgi:TPR repeat protein